MTDHLVLKRVCSVLLGIMLAGCGSALGHDRALQQAPESVDAEGLKSAMFTNPVIAHDFPDPMVLAASDGWYYAYATQTGTAKGMVNVQVARSRDMAHWQDVGDAMPVKPSWAHTTQNFWAPHVVEEHGRYLLYFVAEPDARNGMAIGVAVGTSPTGPFKAQDHFLVHGDTYEAIDPMAFTDPQSGRKFLYWGSASKPLKVRELTPDGLGFLPGSATQEVLQTSDSPHEHLLEGVWVTFHAGYYYMFYSGDNCCGDHAFYSVMVARSKSPTGPFEKRAAALGKPDSVILDANQHFTAPGHNAVVTDAAGTDWMVYHAIARPDASHAHQAISGRPMLIDRMSYVGGWPQVGEGSPSFTAQPGPAIRGRR